MPVLWTEEVMAHFMSSDAFDHMTGFKRVHYQSINLLLPAVHLHLSLVRKQLPPALHRFPHAQLSVVDLFLRHLHYLKIGYNNCQHRDTREGKPVLLRLLLTGPTLVISGK